MPSEREYTIWCRNLFESLREGGIWTVPRSGLVFTRKADRLVLTEAMPYDRSMPITEAQMQEQQDSDFDSIRDHFAAAGITVETEGFAPFLIGSRVLNG